MGAKVTISRNFTSLADLKLVTAADMREIGLLARERIVRRTLRGVDAHGAAFAPYSDGYAKQKAQLGGAAVVNLQLSGNMLSHLQIVQVSENSVTLGWVQ